MQTAPITTTYGSTEIKGEATYYPATPGCPATVMVEAHEAFGMDRGEGTYHLRSAVKRGLVRKQLPDAILAAIDDGARVL